MMLAHRGDVRKRRGKRHTAALACRDAENDEVRVRCSACVPVRLCVCVCLCAGVCSDEIIMSDQR